METRAVLRGVRLSVDKGRLVADLPVHDFFNGPLPEAARLFVKGELV